MKKPLCLLVLAILQITVFAQYWQQQADYTLDVTLNEKERSLHAFAKITYYNNSPDTLHYIWFHLWPNAYKNDRTAFSDQQLESDNTNFYFSNPGERGYINGMHFKVDGNTVRVEDHPQHIDIVRLMLSEPLAPGTQVTITTPFHVQLPRFFSRSGVEKSTFYITQWFPKPAVYDHRGWHPMPYLDQGEFYSEFGNFQVHINVPLNYKVAATGRLISEESEGERKRLLFEQDRIHDFAWFTDSSFRIQKDTIHLASGKVVELESFTRPEQQETFKNTLLHTARALRFYSETLGEYPYSTMTVVQAPTEFGGGMEYQTITMVSPMEEKDLELTIAHEVGHNWFQGVLASNERDFPWLDEGLNTYFEKLYETRYFNSTERLTELLFQTKARRMTDQPVDTHSDSLSAFNYLLSAYHKPAAWLSLLEKKFGKDQLMGAFRNYYEEWKFRHPYPEDFEKVLERELGEGVKEYISLLEEKGNLPGKTEKRITFLFPFKKGAISSYFSNPSKDLLWISPVIGGNSYDRIMLGAAISNYKLPPNRFHFLFVPFYATGSKQFAGLGRMQYSLNGNNGRQIDLLLNGSTFSRDDFTDTAGRKYPLKFTRLVPGFRYLFGLRHPKSTKQTYLQWKTFFINEEFMRVTRDTQFIGADTIPFLRYNTRRDHFYVNQLRFGIEQNRVLYPYSFILQVEQSSSFIRPTFEARYFFNYREGGLQLRFFAGKFIYSNGYSFSKELRTDRYHLNMSGAKGYEDYTYSDYFMGRNEFEGFRSQQIMMRDGGFKVRTDLLSGKVGKTDDWLAAINLSTSVPDKLNPLKVLPIKIPLRLFLDIGTYAEAWEKGAELDRFLYDLGFQIPLFHETINFYFPIMYNQVYGDYFKSTLGKNRFLKTMSFTINFYNREFRKLNRELQF